MGHRVAERIELADEDGMLSKPVVRDREGFEQLKLAKEVCILVDYFVWVAQESAEGLFHFNFDG